MLLLLQVFFQSIDSRLLSPILQVILSCLIVQHIISKLSISELLVSQLLLVLVLLLLKIIVVLLLEVLSSDHILSLESHCHLILMLDQCSPLVINHLHWSDWQVSFVSDLNLSSSTSLVLCKRLSSISAWVRVVLLSVSHARIGHIAVDVLENLLMVVLKHLFVLLRIHSVKGFRIDILYSLVDGF